MREREREAFVVCSVGDVRKVNPKSVMELRRVLILVDPSKNLSFCSAVSTTQSSQKEIQNKDKLSWTSIVEE